MNKTLSDTHVTRFFAGDKKKIKQYMKRFPGRFDNISHFVRSAVISFERQLDQEFLAQRLQKKVKP